MNKINYDRMCMAVIRQQTAAGRVPTLLLHSCCAPCSSATLEWLSQYFQITVFYYNPNIAPEGEFQKRLAEQRRLIAHQPAVHPVQLIAGDYEPAAFAAVAKGYEDCPEGGARCMRCYRQRLERTDAERSFCSSRSLRRTCKGRPKDQCHWAERRGAVRGGLVALGF